MYRGMRTGHALFLLEIKPDIPRIRPWKELFATGVQETWLINLTICSYLIFNFYFFLPFCFFLPLELWKSFCIGITK